MRDCIKVKVIFIQKSLSIFENMKICFVASAESTHTVKWLKYFIDKGHEVHLISNKGHEINGATFHKLTTIGNAKITTERIHIVDIITYLFRAIQTGFIIRKIKPDIVHAHNVVISGFYATMSRFHPLVVTAWGTDVLIAPKRSIILKKIAKYVLKYADVITCDGKNTMEAMLSLGANPEKIKIIYFGIDTKKNSPVQRDEKLKEKLNILNSPTAISLRSFKPIYNLETLIKAIPLVLTKIPDAKFILAGSGVQENSIKKLTKTLGVENNTIFTGNLGVEEVPKYLASSDLYISTSLSDSGLAASTGEAMACGLPVISTDVGCIRDWIKDGEGGFIIPVKDPYKLSDKIIYLFKNRTLMKNFGEINRKTIEERQDYYKEMEKMEKIYGELCKNS